MPASDAPLWRFQATQRLDSGLPRSAEDDHFFDRRCAMKLRLILSVLTIGFALSLHPALARQWTDSSATTRLKLNL